MTVRLWLACVRAEARAGAYVDGALLPSGGGQLWSWAAGGGMGDGRMLRWVTDTHTYDMRAGVDSTPLCTCSLWRAYVTRVRAGLGVVGYRGPLAMYFLNHFARCNLAHFSGYGLVGDRGDGDARNLCVARAVRAVGDGVVRHTPNVTTRQPCAAPRRWCQPVSRGGGRRKGSSGCRCAHGC